MSNEFYEAFVYDYSDGGDLISAKACIVYCDEYDEAGVEYVNAHLQTSDDIITVHREYVRLCAES